MRVGDRPFVDLSNSKSSRWGGGVTADEMREMQWVSRCKSPAVRPEAYDIQIDIAFCGICHPDLQRGPRRVGGRAAPTIRKWLRTPKAFDLMVNTAAAAHEHP